MSRVVFIKLTKVGNINETFNVYDQYDNLIQEDISVYDLKEGLGIEVNDDISFIKLISNGTCAYEKVVEIKHMSLTKFYNTPVDVKNTGCLWKHSPNTVNYNNFYGKSEPYIIEYPIAYQYQDEILRSVKDYTTVYKYTDNIFSTTNRIITDRDYFNKAVLYNGQQSSGLLRLVPKPERNLKEYMSYPKYQIDGKTIIYTKSDNFYQYNDFWNIVINSNTNLFKPTCKSLSIDKEINKDNMDYSKRSFTKSPLRAKYLRIRHILDNKNDIHLVSHFLLQESMVSHK